MKIAEIFARVRLKADVNKVNNYAKAILQLSMNMKKMIDSSLDAASSLKQFEAETGLSTKSLQQWQAVAEQTNVSAKAVAESMKNVSLNQEKMKLGMGTHKGYQLLFLDHRNDPFVFLKNLRKAMQGLSQPMKKLALETLGISSELMRVLDMSEKQFQEMADSALIMPSHMIDALDSTRSSLVTVVQAFKYLKAMLAVELAPAIKQLAKHFVAFVKKDGAKLVRFLLDLVKIVVLFIQALGTWSGMFYRLIRDTVGFKVALTALLAIIVALNAAFLFSPIGLFLMSALALFLVLDDIYGYTQGKNSVFGDVLKEMPKLEGALKLLGLLGASKEDLAKIREEFGNWATVIDGVRYSLWLLIETLLVIPRLFNNMFSGIGQLNDLLKMGKGSNAKLTPKAIEAIRKTQVEKAGGYVGPPPAPVKIGDTTLNIYGVKDAAEASQQMQKELEETVSSAWNRYNGVDESSALATPVPAK